MTANQKRKDGTLDLLSPLSPLISQIRVRLIIVTCTTDFLNWEGDKDTGEYITGNTHFELHLNYEIRVRICHILCCFNLSSRFRHYICVRNCIQLKNDFICAKINSDIKEQIWMNLLWLSQRRGSEREKIWASVQCSDSAQSKSLYE